MTMLAYNVVWHHGDKVVFHVNFLPFVQASIVWVLGFLLRAHLLIEGHNTARLSYWTCCQFELDVMLLYRLCHWNNMLPFTPGSTRESRKHTMTFCLECFLRRFCDIDTRWIGPYLERACILLKGKLICVTGRYREVLPWRINRKLDIWSHISLIKKRIALSSAAPLSWSLSWHLVAVQLLRRL